MRARVEVIVESLRGLVNDRNCKESLVEVVRGIKTSEQDIRQDRI